MNLDNLLENSSEKLIDNVINNATTDAENNPIEDAIVFETSNENFGNESGNIFDQETKETETKQTASISKNTTTSVENSELSEQDKKRNLLYCQLYVLMMGEGVEILCKLISGEWDDSQPNKYSVAKSKQNEVARAWAEVLNMEASRKSPKGALVMLIFSMFLPILFVALKTRFVKWKSKKAELKNPKKTPEKQTQVINITPEVLEEKKESLNDFQNTQNREIAEFLHIDQKKTAEVLSTEIKKEQKKVDKKTEPKKKGRKTGTARNPNTGNYEMFQDVVMIDKKPYYVFSWGDKKMVPKDQQYKFLKK